MCMDVNMAMINATEQVNSNQMPNWSYLPNINIFSDEFPHAGQNIYVSHDSDDYPDAEEVIRDAFKAWNDEYKMSNMKIINSGKHPRLKKKNHEKSHFYSYFYFYFYFFVLSLNSGVGHFTQNVRDRVQSIGCALARYEKGDEYDSYFVCDYNETNMGAVYGAGRFGVDCQSGHHEKYPALCKRSEKYETIEAIAMAAAVAAAHARVAVRKH